MAETQIKDCSVVVVKLLDEILIRGTVKVYQIPPLTESDYSDSDSSKDELPSAAKSTSESLQRLQKCLDKIPLERPPKRTDTAHKISVYTKIDKSDVITEVKCRRFRKRKVEYDRDTSDVETDVKNVVDNLVERASCSMDPAKDINYNSPGTQEVELVKEFCKENGFATEDYDDLKDLFTFRTLPLEESQAVGQKRTKKRKAWREPLRKILRQRSVDNLQKSATPSIQKDHDDVKQTESPPESTPYPSGLENIENEKIRKILEDFGRLSKSQVSLNSNEPKKILPKNKEKTLSNSQGRNSVIVKPLNLCKKDNKTDADKTNESTKTDQGSEKQDPQAESSSILKSLLYLNTAETKRSVAKDSETQTDNALPIAINKTEKRHAGITKKTKSQQTDLEDENHSIPHQETKNSSTNSSTPPEIQTDNSIWINDPNAILAKIQKLKRDIVYLDLLAEEKEKERIAILCFKSYKESILRKIFANEAANKAAISAFQKECSASTPPCSNGSNHPVTPVIIPELIHTVKVPIRNGLISSTLPAPFVTNIRTLYPSTVSFLQAIRPQPCVVQSPHIKTLFGTEKNHSWSQSTQEAKETSTNK